MPWRRCAGVNQPLQQTGAAGLDPRDISAHSAAAPFELWRSETRVGHIDVTSTDCVKRFGLAVPKNLGLIGHKPTRLCRATTSCPNLVDTAVCWHSEKCAGKRVSFGVVK
jgi:hypothetical protein